MSRLTPRSIKKIALPKAERGPEDHPDSLVTGLCLTVRPSGVMTWTLRYRVAGIGKRYAVGKYPTMSLKAARKRAQTLSLQIADGIDPQAVKVAQRSGETTDAFPDQAIRFIETYARPQNKSWLAQARLLGLSLNPQARRTPALERHWKIIPGSPAARWCKRTVGSIAKREIVDAVDAATERGPIVANRVHATLTRFFSWAVEKGVIEVSPAIGTKAPNPERSRDRVLAPEELSVIWHAAGELRAPFGAFVRLLILTAARRNQVAGIREAEIAEGVWTLPAQSPEQRAKGGVANMLPLPKQALEIIAELPRSASGLLLATTGDTPISGFSKMKRQLDGLVADSRKIAPWTLHDIRRSAATGCASLGIEPHVVEAILGHRAGVISGVAAVYNKFTYSREKAVALQRWADCVSLHNMI